MKYVRSPFSKDFRDTHEGASGLYRRKTARDLDDLDAGLLALVEQLLSLLDVTRELQRMRSTDKSNVSTGRRQRNREACRILQEPVTRKNDPHRQVTGSPSTGA
jgi:hypothetical protein